jgi:hypothetical protein
MTTDVKKPEDSRLNLTVLLATFRECGQQLQAVVDERFPVGCIVRVNNPRFHGIGEVRGSDDCPLDKLPVLVESGNTWWYELETIIERVPVAQWPRWVRQSKLRTLRNGSETRRLMAAVGG